MRLNVSQERAQEHGHRPALIPFGSAVAGTRPPIASVPEPQGDAGNPSLAAPESSLAGRRVAPLVMGLLVRALGTPALDAAPDVARELRTAGDGSDPSFATVVRLAREATELLRGRGATEKARVALEATLAGFEQADEAARIGQLEQALLELLLLTCHPALPRDLQAALLLTAAAGLEVEEIAGAFQVDPTAVQRRGERGGRRIRALRVLPSPLTVMNSRRVAPALDVLFLVFGEGFASPPPGEHNHVGRMLCQQSLWLTTLLAKHLRGRVPEAHALLALLCFQYARFDSRYDEQARMVPMLLQDRSGWHPLWLRRGFDHLERAERGADGAVDASELGLLANLAACHAAAKSFQETRWPLVLAYLNELVQRNPNPLYLLERAVAVGMLHGASAGMEAVHRVATLAQFTRLNFFNFHPLDPKKRRDFLAAAGPLYRDTIGFRMEPPLAEAVLARAGAWPRQVNGA